MALVPVKIVTTVGNDQATAGLIDRRVFRQSEMVIVDTAVIADQADISGGLVPITQDEYDASAA